MRGQYSGHVTSIDQLEFRVLELQRELDEQEERDKDFLMLQRLAEEEVRTKTLKQKATHTKLVKKQFRQATFSLQA